MRVIGRLVSSAALLAAFAFGPLAEAQPLFRPVDPDPAASRWIRHAGWRLDRMLGPAPADERAAGAHAELRIAEATLQIDEKGIIRSWAVTRATGRPPIDDAMFDAVEDLTMINLPPPPPSIAGRTIVLQVAFLTPPRIGPRSSLIQMGPPVLMPGYAVGEATGPAPVVITARR